MSKKIHAISVQKPYFVAISKGSKTIEGRLYKGKYSEIHPGDFCYFFCPENPDTGVYCKIQQTRLYPSFKEMLEKEGLQKCLPSTPSIEEGVSIYHSFPGYKSGEITFGVIALEILLESPI